MSGYPRTRGWVALLVVALAVGCKPGPTKPPPDVPAPKVVIEGVSEGQVSREPLLPTWRVESSGPATEEATLDGAPFVSGTAVKAEGPHELVVVARDNAGREGRARVGFAIDTTAPRLTVSGVEEGQRYNTPVVLGFTVEEEHPGTVEATLDGARVASGDTVSAEGSHELVVVATDAVGNRAEARRRFSVDVTPPTLTVLSPESGTSTRAGTVEVVVAAVDDAPVAGVWLGSEALARGEDGNYRGTVVLEEGSNLLVLLARDVAGNTARHTLQVTRDSTPPQLTVTTPGEGAKVAGDSVRVEGRVEDAASVTVRAGGQAAAVEPDGHFQLTVAVAQGAVSLEVVATDVAGNTTRLVRAFRANTTPPRLDVSSPASGTSTEEPSIVVSGFARAADRLDTVKLEVAGGEHGVGADGRFSVEVPLAPGLNTVSITAVDGYGLRTPRTVRVERLGGPVDGGSEAPDAGMPPPDAGTPSSDAGTPPVDGGAADEPPVLVLASPQEDSLWGVERVAVLGRVEGGTPPLEVTVEGLPASVTGRQFSASLALPEGSSVLRVRAVDALGRSSEARRQVRVDQTPPFLEVTRPELPTTTVTESPYLVEGLAGDAYLGGVTVNGEPALVLAGRFSASVPLVPGDNSITVEAVDLARNRAQVTRTLRVDGMPPRLRVLEPAEGSEARTPVVRVTMSVEASAPLAEVRIGTGLATQAGAGQYTAQVPLALGENVIPLMARDTLGLTGTASVRVRYRDPRTEPLVVTGVDPTDQTEGVEPDALVNVAFNKPVKPDSVRDRFTVSAGGQPLPGGWSVAPGGQTVSFIAREPLPESASLQVRVAGVEPVEGPGMQGEFRSVFTVRRPLTVLHGSVVDERREPLPGVRVEVEGQGLSTHTGPDGAWALFGVAPGRVVLRYEGGAQSTGKLYPTVRRGFVVEAERDNQGPSLMLVPVDAESAEPVDTAGPVHLTFGGRHGALALDIPAGGLSFADGNTRGRVMATELPALDRPVPLDGTVGPAWLWQLHPSGTHVMAPVKMRLPNRDKAPPGHRAVLFTYEPFTHLLRAVGLATVSEDGTQVVSDGNVEAGSLEFFGYLPLPEDTSASSSLAQGFFGLGLPEYLSITPSMVLVTGNVRGPREQAVVLTLKEPALVQSQPVALDSGGSHRLKLSFQGRTLVPLQPGQRKPLVALVSAVGPHGGALGSPSGSPWRQESPEGSQVELSSEVELKPGVTQLTLSVSTERGRDVVRLEAELSPDSAGATDGGTSWRLRVQRVSTPSPEELEGQGVVRFTGMPVSLYGTWGDGFSFSGAAGRYVAPVPHLQSYFLPPTLVRACVKLPAWPRVQPYTDASGRVQTRVFSNRDLEECSPVHEVWYTQESLGPVDVFIDARYLHGSLTFVDRQGQALPPACESKRDPATGKLLSLSSEDVRTTEVHFFLEQDLSQPIVTYTVAHPYDCEETPSSGAQGRYTRLRMGPSALRWLGDGLQTSSLRRNSTRLVPGDRLVVFAVNHATGYAGMSTVTVPPISTSTRNADGSCPADEAEGGPIIVKEGGQSVSLSRCTLQDLGIQANVQLYPPELDVRVERRARAEGVEKKEMDPSLVRHGGAATTRDDFISVATDWRVRRAPAPARPEPGVLSPADPSCDGGVRLDGGVCGPQSLQDEGRKGWVLERYCSQLTPPLTPEQEQVCLRDDSALTQVPPGVPPLAGRVVRITGSAVEEPAVATFKISPGRSTSTVQTALRMVGQDGKAVVFNNLPRANHYVQVVGHSVFPRDRDQDGVIKPAEENAPPPDFSDGVGAPGLPRGAVELKNVYRSLEADGGVPVERYDVAREHEFRVLEVGSAQVTAQTDRAERSLSDGGTAGRAPAASPEDVAYQFLLKLLEPADDGRAGTLSGEYALRLGSDSFGIDCPIKVDAAAGTLRGTCAGEYVPEVLSANDIVYLEVYLRGNAENVLYRFNFDGLSMREDYVGAASKFTAARAVEEKNGKPVLDRPVSQLNEAHFFLGPQQLESGRLRLCTTEDCSGDSLIKEALLSWQGAGKYSVQEQEGGRATTKLVQEDKPGAGGARHFRLALPASLTRMPGAKAGSSPSPIYLVTDSVKPRLEHKWERLGAPEGRFQGLSAHAPGQESVAGIGLADLRLSFTHTDFAVPQYAETVSFSRTYSNQNDLPSPLGVGWRHAHDGFVWEELLGRYVVILGGQAWGFNECQQVDKEKQTASQCKTDKTHGMELEVDGLGVKVTTEYGHVYRFDRPAVKRDKEGRRKWLLTKFHDGHGRGETEGWTHLTYAEGSNRLLKVKRTPGVLTLEFKYCEDFTQDDCEGLPSDAAGNLKVLARAEDFKLLEGVVLKHGSTLLHVVRFKHDKWGNLLEAERTTDPPAQRWKYTYENVPEGVEGRKAWRAVNELSEARFEVADKTQWLATYDRGGAECYEHLESFECVTGVKQTGSRGQPLKVQGSLDERTVALPDGALARMGLNDYGNATSVSLGGTRTMSWPSSERGGEVRLASSTSPGGRTLKYLADERMRTAGVQVKGVSDVVGLGENLVTVTSRGAHGRPEAGTIATANGAASWSMPRSAAGDVSGLSVGSISLLSRTWDAEGRISTETDALGNTTTYVFGGALELPTSATVTGPGAGYGLELEYDGFGRLTRRFNDSTGAEETWRYDGQGNVLQHTRAGQPSEVRTYTYTYGDQELTVVESLQGAYTRTLVFKEGLLRSESGPVTRTYAYDKGGRLEQKTDERGVVWTYSRDEAGRLTALKANGKPFESYTLDADGNVKVRTDREGRTLQIGYDGLGQAVSWLYEDGHLEEVKRDAQGAIVSQKSTSPGAPQRTFAQQLDVLGRVLSTQSAGGVEVRATYDAAGRVLTREDVTLGLRESFEYNDALGRLTRHTRHVQSEGGEQTWEEVRQYTGTRVDIQRTIGARTETQTLRFDALGRLLSEEGPGARRVDFTYDARGNVLTRLQSGLGLTTYTYDGRGNLLSKEEPGGILTTYTTDAAGLVLSQQGPHEEERWTFSYDDFSRLTSRTLAAAGSTPAATWSFTHQGSGVVKETNPLGSTITRTFNPRGLLLSEVQGARTTEYAYDGTWPRLRKVSDEGQLFSQTREFDDLGRALVEVESWAQGGHSYTYRTATPWSGRSATRTETWEASDAPSQVRTSTVRTDSLGNLVAVEQGGLRDTWTYDAAGVLVREALAGRPEKLFIYEQALLSKVQYGAETTHYTHDGAGRLLTETDPSGRKRTLRYNAQGRVQQESFGWAGDTLTTAYTYDQGGFLEEMTRGGEKWRYTHGPRGELQSVALPAGLGLFTYQHDALLQLTAITPPARGSAPQSFTYDELGRRTSRTRGISVWTTSWQGGKSTTADPNGDVVVRTYDVRGRVAGEQYRPGSQSQPHTDLTAVAYAYDGLDQLLAAKETRNSGAISNVYGYDGRSRLISLKRGGDTVTYAYTSSGQRQSVTSPAGTVSYAYDAQDRVQRIDSSQGPSVTVEWEPGGLLSKVSGGGVVEQYAHYGHGKVHSISSMRDGRPLTRYEYTYDDRGNRLQELYTGLEATLPEMTQYGYDQADRLTSVHYASGESELYLLSGDGTRLEETRVAGSSGTASRHLRYFYDPAGGLKFIDDGAGGVEASFTTDAAGRVVAEVRGGTTRQYGWDAAGRLASIKQMGAEQAVETTYTYGFDGLRRGRMVGGVASRYVWGAGEELIEEQLPDAAPRPLLRVGGSVVAEGRDRILRDGLGSAVARIDEGGMVTSYRYGAWGNYRGTARPASGEPSLGYTGHAYDADTGLTYAQQRWLDTSTGRFLSEDPVEAGAYLKTPQGLNPWMYAAGNPARYTDPDGRCVNFFAQDVVSWSNCVDSGKVLAGYAMGVGETAVKVVAAPGVLTYNITGAALHAMTGESKYEAQAQSFNEGLYGLSGAVAQAVDAPKQTAKNIAHGLKQQVVQQVVGIGTAIEKGDLYAAGNGTGKLVAETALALEGGVQSVRGGMALAKRGVALVDNAMPGTSRAAAKAARKRDTGESPGANRCVGGECNVPGYCFAAGTLIETSEGKKPIEQVTVGDYVLSKGEDSETRVWRRVEGTRVTPDRPVGQIMVAAEDGTRDTITATPDHPFWVVGQGWTEAADLKAGDLLVSAHGGWLRVTGGVWAQERADVYNFSVEETHTYFVGTTGTWVHNADCVPEQVPSGGPGLSSAGQTAGTTRLWRVVEAEELADVFRFGDYNIHGNSTFKRFGFSEGDADAFIKANPTRSYTKTYVELPTDKLRFMTEHPDPGGVGRAIGIDVYETPQFYDWFIGGVKVVP